MPPIDGDILGKLILLQSTLHAIQDDETMARFAACGFAGIPSMDAVGICLNGKCCSEYQNADVLPIDLESCRQLYGRVANATLDLRNTLIAQFKSKFNLQCLRIETIFKLYGFLFLRTQNAQLFAGIRPYVENTLNLVALAMENNQQKSALTAHQQTLERVVAERTRELEQKVSQLRTEIKERRKAETELAQGRSFIQHIIETSPNWIYIYDLEEQRNVFANQAVKAFLGYTKKDIEKMGSGIIPLTTHPDDQELIKAHHQKLRTVPDQQVVEIIYRAKYAQGAWRWMQSRDVAFLRNPAGQVKQILGIAEDITTKKEIEETCRNLEDQLRQAHKMEAIGTLAGGIAHDFNNILGIILGNAELAIDDTPGWHPAKHHLEEIITAGLRAKDVVRQLLSFSRNAEPVKHPLHIEQVLGESLKLLRASIPTSIEIQFQAPTQLPSIEADATQIHQILINLCTNAAHAMEEQGGTLTISLQETEQDIQTADQFRELPPGSYIQLSVKDSGCGIPFEIQDKVFDPYFTTKEFGKGMGMGLAVVHGIVAGLGGAIALESEPGNGTLFNVLFPVSEQTPDSTSPTQMDFSKAKDLLKGTEKILLVDDEAALLQTGYKILYRLGYQVETTTDPAQALSRVQVDPDQYQLVITDMTMPKMNGDQLAGRILQIRHDMPIILCTGYNEKINHDRAHALGIRRLLEKPLKISEMAQTVRTVLDEK